MLAQVYHQLVAKASALLAISQSPVAVILLSLADKAAPLIDKSVEEVQVNIKEAV